MWTWEITNQDEPTAAVLRKHIRDASGRGPGGVVEAGVLQLEDRRILLPPARGGHKGYAQTARVWSASGNLFPQAAPTRVDQLARGLDRFWPRSNELAGGGGRAVVADQGAGKAGEDRRKIVCHAATPSSSWPGSRCPRSCLR
jgi:hypothetical protein